MGVAKTGAGSPFMIGVGSMPGEIAVDDADVYWIDAPAGAAGRLSKHDKTGAGATTVLYDVPTGTNGPRGLSINSQTAFFQLWCTAAECEDAYVASVPKAGGPPVETMVTCYHEWFDGFAVDDTKLVVACQDVLTYLPLDVSGTATKLWSYATGVPDGFTSLGGPIVLSGDDVFFRQAAYETFGIRKAKVCDLRWPANVMDGAVGDVTTQVLVAVDEDHLYWSDGRSIGRGPR